MGGKDLVARCISVADMTMRDLTEVDGFRRFLAVVGPPRTLDDIDATGRRKTDGVIPLGRIIHLQWPWLAYALGETGPPPRLWWLDDPTDNWTGGDQA